MKFFTKTSILVKIAAAVVILSLLSAILTSVTSFHNAKKSLNKEISYKLEAVNEAKSHELKLLMDFIESDLSTMSENPGVINALKAFKIGWEQMGDTAAPQLKNLYVANNSNSMDEKFKLDYANDGSQYSESHKAYHAYLRSKMLDARYANIYLFDDVGNLIYSVDKQADYATNFLRGTWAGTALGQAYRNAIDSRSGDVFFYDFAAYDAKNNTPSSFISTTIYGENKTPIGVLAFELPPTLVTDLFESLAGLGHTGEVYVVGPDKLARSNLQGVQGESVLKSMINTQAVVDAFKGGKGVEIANDYLGNATIVAYSDVKIFDTQWAVIAQENIDEAFKPIEDLKTQIFIQLLILSVILTALGYFVARSVAKPIKAINTAMVKVATGDTETDIPYQHRSDEIGDMSKSLAQFRDDLGEAAIANRISLFKGSAFDGSSMPMMITDRDINVTYVNDGTKRLFHNYQAEFSRVFNNFDAHDSIGTCTQILQRVLSDYRYLVSDPSNLPFDKDVEIGDLKFHVSMSGVFDREGEYQGVVLQWNDVTETRRDSALIKAINGAQAVIEFNLDGTILNANENFLSGTGYSLEEVKGKHHSIFVLPEYANSTDYKLFWDRLSAGEAIVNKFSRVKKSGEILWLDASYNSIRDDKGSPYKVVKIATDITASEINRIRQEEFIKENTNKQNNVVAELAESLKNLSKGDLMSRIECSFPSEYEMLRVDFNSAVDQLNSTIQRVSTSVDSIQGGANEMSQSSDDLSKRTENQAAALEETAAALDEVTATVKETAKAAAEARNVVTSARSDAETGGEVVRETVNAMSSIQESSEKISKIIGVIDEIAFQTNLLALNAGVEAARAGEAGRGFAVVASEVRALAQRSSDAAKDIKDLISASAEHVQTGVSLVDQTGSALDKIVGQVANVDALVSDIAASAIEQATGLAEVNSAVNEMDRVTQKNAAMVEESTAACHALTNESAQLSRLVAHFDIGLIRSPLDSTVTHMLSPATFDENPVHKEQGRAAAYFATSQGSAALSIEIDDENDWQDF